MFTENLKIALRALWANRMRSVLTMLGIIIGVASVIAVVSIVQGLQHNIENELQGVGATYVLVVPDAGEERNSMGTRMPDLTYDDGVAIRRQAPEIREFTPIFYTSAEAKIRDTTHRTQLLGVSSSYQEVVNHWVERGRFFTALDTEAKKRVATIGVEAARKLGIQDDPIGQKIQVANTAFTVVGTMEKKGRTLGQDSDDLILIPFTTAGLVYGPERLKSVRLDFQARRAESIDLAEDQIREILRSRHHLKEDEPDDFRIILQEEILETVSTFLTNTSLVMGAVVGIALLVGGIGIMNIMLVSVTERTREIGIRKAIGARRQDVLVQFLIEAITLSGAGGVMGIAGGMLLARLVQVWLKSLIDFPAVHTPLWAVFVAFGFCGALGVIFGIYPAAKASKLDPIEALRYE